MGYSLPPIYEMTSREIIGAKWPSLRYTLQATRLWSVSSIYFHEKFTCAICGYVVIVAKFVEESEVVTSG